MPSLNYTYRQFGHIHFAFQITSCVCRPLKVSNASLLVTAESVLLMGRTVLSVGLQPCDNEDATMDFLEEPMHIVDVNSQPVEVRPRILDFPHLTSELQDCVPLLWNAV